MPETIQNNGLWHILLAENDLVEQVGLNRDDFEQGFGFFRFKGRTVVISHKFNNHLVVSMEGEEDEDLTTLMNAFSIVVGYKSFCKYNLRSETRDENIILPTYEWDKIDPTQRFQELESQKNVLNLTKV